MANDQASAFFRELAGQRVAVCGIGRNNTPVLHQLISHGVSVTACDRRTREELGDLAAELESAGVALRLGENYLDGLDAALILRTPGMKPYLPQLETARARGAVVTSEMELFFSLCPAPIYAVTGSDGKTTTTSIIAGLLEAAGKRVHLGGNIGRPLLPEIDRIAPEDAAVAELSSFQLTGMSQSPHVAVVTNVTPNHLDWHADMAEYTQAKRNLVAWQRAGDRAVLNADDPATAAFAGGLASTVCFFSLKGPVARGAYVEDGLVKMAWDGVAYPVMPTAGILLPGTHNVANYLAATAAVWGEVEPALIARFAAAFGGVPHRCELVRDRGGVRWYNDAIGTSPTRTIAGLEAFTRPVILIAGGYDKRLSYTPLTAAARGRVKSALLMGATADAIQAALEPAGVPCARVADMEEAVRLADAQSAPGDAVFLSPASASFDMYRNFEEKGNHFRDLVKQLEDYR